jgi:hypothetical protein
MREVRKSPMSDQNQPCDKDRTPDAIKEMERYCEMHSNGPAAVRRPKLSMRGRNYVVLLGNSVGDGIVGFGSTVSAALRAFDLQYLKTIRPPQN